MEDKKGVIYILAPVRSFLLFMLDPGFPELCNLLFKHSC